MSGWRTLAHSHLPGKKCNYDGWFTEAKRKETRDRRVVQAVTWLAEEKRRY
jgi:uncharacterized protein YdeI (YjbR/CyaY-like superfamily)